MAINDEKQMSFWGRKSSFWASA